MNFSDLMIEADDLNSNGNVVNVSKKNGINITDVVNGDGLYLTMEFSDIIDNNIIVIKVLFWRWKEQR